ncbi:MAG: protease pro-enzyme activation domain-containing protein [Actinomycetota bacterium]
MTRRILVLAITAGLVAGACTPSPSRPPDGRSAPRVAVRPAGGSRGVSPHGGGRFLEETDRAQVLDFSVVLRLAHQAAMRRFLHDLNDPTSSSYRRFLTAAEFGQRFGLPARQVARVRAELQGAGFAVHSVYPQRTGISLSGPVGAIDEFFATRLGDFRDAGGRRYIAPLRDPVVPDSLRPSVSAVAGLNGLAFPATLAIPHGQGLLPDDAAKAYDATPLRDQGILGQGQTIAIVSFGSFRDQDVNAFDTAANVDAPPIAQSIEHVPVNGGNDNATGDIAGEVNLDVDVVRGMAPQAKILNYETPLGSLSSFTQGMGAAVNQIVADGRADSVSISYGLCDALKLADGSPFLSPGDRALSESAFAAARSAGISVFVAAGDTGAFGCQRFDLNDTRVVPLWPGDSPNVISVGGTLLSVRQDGTYLQEAGWEDILSQSGTGGGVNPSTLTADALPQYQQGDLQVNGKATPVLDSQRNPDGRRQGPDVAASADPDSGFFSVSPGQGGRPQGSPVGGTSAATPFWAASMLLIRQFAEQQGAGPLGFVDDMLYRIAATKMNYDGVDDPSEPFHDVVIGGNRSDDCRVGWDFATGLGSPNVAALAQDVVQFLKQNKPSG